MGRTSLVPASVRAALREILPVSQAVAARRLIRRANAARDARQFGVAAALYQEALRFNPDNVRARIQCGHMLKDSGDLVGAEEQYKLAEQQLPSDADLALQIGHLHKLAGRPERAEASYARALALSPGWRIDWATIRDSRSSARTSWTSAPPTTRATSAFCASRISAAIR